MKYQAILNNVIVTPYQPKDKTKSGIYIPFKEKRPGKGEIISIGEQVKSVKVGDKVLHQKWEGREIKVDGEVWMSMKESDLFAILDSYEL